MTLEPLPTSGDHARATTQALQELWSLNELQAKKVVSIVIILTVESAIILLSLVAGIDRRKVAKAPVNNGVLAELQQRYQKNQVHKFLAKCKTSLTKKGRLPLASELGRGQREMKKLIHSEEFNKTSIEEMLNQLNEGPEKGDSVKGSRSILSVG